MTRRNSYSGIRYCDEPAIFAWELMNEPRCVSNSSGPHLQVIWYSKTLNTGIFQSENLQQFTLMFLDRLGLQRWQHMSRVWTLGISSQLELKGFMALEELRGWVLILGTGQLHSAQTSYRTQQWSILILLLFILIPIAGLVSPPPLFFLQNVSYIICL